MFLAGAAPIAAQNRPTPTSTVSAQIATEAGVVREFVEPKREHTVEKDLTQSSGPAKSRLALILDETPAGSLTPFNAIQHAIRWAVEQGVPANMLVLTLLFPVIASFVAVSRHIIGLEGFGIYTPAVLAVAFMSTGIITGILLFVSILIIVGIGRQLLGKLRLQYLPRTALLLWLVSLAVFGLLLLSPFLSRININVIGLNIFPVLVLVLLSENFLEAQISGTQKRALELTMETLVLAVLSAIFMRMGNVQRFVILHPEITLASVLALDVAISRYTGLRFSEYFRFKPIIDTEE